MARLTATADESLVEQVENYAENADMSKSDVIRNACRFAIGLDPALLSSMGAVADADTVVGVETASSPVNLANMDVDASDLNTDSVPDSESDTEPDGDADGDVDVNSLTPGHDVSINPDNRNLDEEVVNTNRQRAIVMEGVLRHIRETELHQPFLSEAALERAIQRAFGGSEASVEGIKSVLASTGILTPGVSSDPRILDNVHKLKAGAVSYLESTRQLPKADGLDRHVNTVYDLSGRWDGDRDRISGSWWPTEEMWFFDDSESDREVIQDYMRSTIANMADKCNSGVGSKILIGRTFAIAVTEGWMPLEEAVRMLEELCGWNEWISQAGVESVLVEPPYMDDLNALHSVLDEIEALDLDVDDPVESDEWLDLASDARTYYLTVSDSAYDNSEDPAGVVDRYTSVVESHFPTPTEIYQSVDCLEPDSVSESEIRDYRETVDVFERIYGSESNIVVNTTELLDELESASASVSA